MILMKLNLSWKVYLRKENSPGSLSEGVLLAVGGRYDYLLHQLWRSDSVGYPHFFFLIDFEMTCIFYPIFLSVFL